MKVPDEIYAKVKEELWKQADRDNWISISPQQKSSIYEQWSSSKNIGEMLSRYMDRAEVRVYLKDTIMKPYARSRTSDVGPALQAAGIQDPTSIKEYEKPHGRLLFGQNVICWGEAKDWKDIILAVFERAYRESAKPHAAVLFRGIGKMAQPSERKMTEEAAKLLKIEHVFWPD